VDYQGFCLLPFRTTADGKAARLQHGGAYGRLTWKWFFFSVILIAHQAIVFSASSDPSHQGVPVDSSTLGWSAVMLAEPLS